MSSIFQRNLFRKFALIANLLLVLFFVSFVLTKLSGPKVPTGGDRVTLQPIEADKSRISYPFVRVMPKDPQYRAIYALEKFKVYNDDANELFLAKKRVAEILEWGNTFEIAYSLPSDQFRKDPLLLVAWWDQKERRWYLQDSQTTFNFWEVEIARYANHIQSYLKSGNQDEVESSIKRGLSVQRDILDDMSIINGHIDKMHLPDSDKRYLLTTSTLIFEELLKKTKTLERDGLGIRQFYSVQKSVSADSSTLVDIYVDPLQLFSPIGLTLSTGNKKYLPIYSGDPTKYLKFSDVLLAAGESVISLNYPQSNKIAVSNFKLKEANHVRIYEHNYDIPQQMQGYPYLLDYVSYSSTVRRLTLVKNSTYINDYLNRREPKKDIQFSGPIISFHTPQQFTKILSHGNENIESVKLRLAYDYPKDSPEDYSNDFATLTPITKTELILVKSNTGVASSQGILSATDVKWWSYAVFILNIFIATLLGFMVYQKRIYRALNVLATRHIIPLFIIFVIGFITDTFLLAYNFEAVTYSLIVVWILFLFGSGVNGRFQFALGSILLVIGALTSSFGMINIAEKASAWVFIFVGFGVFQLVHHDDRKTTMKSHLVSNHLPYIRHIAKLLRQYLAYLYKFISWSFELRPLNLRDVTRNFAVALAYGMIVVGLYIGIGFLQNYLLRQSYDPVIYSQQPSIVYNSTKVVLHGRRFGWNTDKKSTLQANGKPLNVSLWTDTEIVFEVPLDIAVGKLSIRIDKPVFWNGKNSVTRSNTATLRVISRTNGWDEEDDLFFKQLKSLPSEVRKINGYE